MISPKRTVLEIDLNYSRPGDDMSGNAQAVKNAMWGFRYHANQMRQVADHLQEISEMLEEFDNRDEDHHMHECGVDAYDDHIRLICPIEIGEKIVDRGLGEYSKSAKAEDYTDYSKQVFCDKCGSDISI